MFYKNGDATIVEIVKNTEDDDTRENVLAKALEDSKNYQEAAKKDKSEN